MNKSKSHNLLCLGLAIFLSRHAFGQQTSLPAPFGPHPWTATVKVIGEDGNPIMANLRDKFWK